MLKFCSVSADTTPAKDVISSLLAGFVYIHIYISECIMCVYVFVIIYLCTYVCTYAVCVYL
jgi:hypothetical protein